MSSAWISRTLSDCFTVTNEKGKQLKSTEYQTSGLLPVVDQSEQFICGFTDEIEKQYGGPLPITVFGDHSRHVKYVDFRFAAGADGTQLLRPCQGIDDRFFYYVVARASTLIGNYGYDRHLKHLRRFEADFPASVAEQRKIARILSTVDDLIERTEGLIAKYRAIKQGLMHDLLTRGVDACGRLRPPREEAPGLYRESSVGWVPREWDACKMQDVVPKAEYGISSPLHDQGKLPVVRMNNLNAGGFVLDDLKYTSDSVPPNLMLKARDVLFNRTNSMEHVGRTSIWLKGFPEATFASYLVRLVPDPDRLLPEYLNLWLNQPATQIAIRRSATPGVHQVNINPTNLRRTEITFPGAISEQAEIVERLAGIERFINTNRSYLSKLNHEKAGLMQDLLTGRVRVKATDAFGSG